MGASKADGGLRATVVRVGAAGSAAEVISTFQFDQSPINLAEQGVEPGRYYLVVTNSAVGTSSVRTAVFPESSETLSCLPEDSTAGGGGVGTGTRKHRHGLYAEPYDRVVGTVCLMARNSPVSI